MERVEVEPHERQHCRRNDSRQKGRSKHADTMPGHEAIDRRQEREADFRVLGRRKPQQDQKRRQQRNAEHERHDHAETSDSAEFGHAEIAGRQESEEADADRNRRQDQGPSDTGARRDQRRFARRLDQALGEAADAELDTEIDAETDEEWNEGNGDEVEPPGRPQPEGRRHGKADKGRDHDGKDDPDGPDGQPENTQQRHDHCREDDIGVLSQRHEFFVAERHGTGQPDSNAVSRIEAKRTGGLPNRRARGCARLQLRIVQHRLDQYDAPRYARFGRRSGDEGLPGKVRRLSCHRLLDGIGEGTYHRPDTVERTLLGLDALRRGGHRRHDASQARVGVQQRQERGHLPQARHCRPDLIERQKQQAFTLEEGTGVGTPHRVEKPGFLFQGSGQLPRRAFGQFRRSGVDDDQGQVVELGERRFESQLPLSPLQLRRDQLRDVGGHREVAGREDQRRRREHEGKHHHHDGMPAAGRHDAADRRTPGRHDASPRFVQPGRKTPGPSDPDPEIQDCTRLVRRQVMQSRVARRPWALLEDEVVRQRRE